MGLFKNSRKAKNNVIIIGSNASGTMKREYLKPNLITITGRILMNNLLINGKYADGCRQFTNKEILNALKRCLKLIDTFD